MSKVLAPGTLLWIPAGKDDPAIFAQAKVLAVDEFSATVRTEDKHKRLETLDFSVSPPMLCNPTVEPDMTGLNFIHEPGILYNMEQRSLKSEPYSFMGSVLVAVNPLRAIINPTTVGTRAVLMGPPHPYAVAESSFQQMTFQGSRELSLIEKKQNGTLRRAGQSIVIGGESGAGKTESSKMVLQHLVNRQSKASAENSARMNGLDSRLLGTNPILESFGNATTLRNPNSSRFGKMLRLHFDPPPTSMGTDEQWTLRGATVQSYLLERSRVTTHEMGERGYHIMYLVAIGAENKLDKSLFDLDMGGGPGKFKYLVPLHPKPQPAKDLEFCKEVVEAMEAIGLDAEVRKNVFEVVAGIMHMGNMEFGEKESNDGASAFVSNQPVLDVVSRLLGVDGVALSKIFCERRFEVAGKEVVTVRNARAASFAKDAVAKAIYSGLFDWIIKRIDVALGGAGTNPDTTGTIGVLDIFGFEVFAVNGFEQLLINYTNESLQGTFNAQIFIAEAALYQKEGLFGSDEYLGQPLDNGICIELLQGKGTDAGLLMTIDSEGRVPDPNDAKLNVRLHTNFAAHPCMIKPHPKDKASTFIIKHYAATVTYTIGTFLEKNNDRLPDDMESTLKTSSKNTVREIFEQDKPAAPPAPPPPTKGGKPGPPPRKAPARSIVHKFQAQIKQLVEDLEATKCSFIRCVKPNLAMVRDDADPTWFDRRYVQKQLNALNIAQTAEVLRNGFPTRIEYAVLVEQYVPVMPANALKSYYSSANEAGQKDNRTFVRALFWAFAIDQDIYKLGYTRVFFKGGKLAELQAVMKAATAGPIADDIVKRFTYYYARVKWRKAAIGALAQKRFLELCDRAKKRRFVCERIQSLVRMQIHHQKYKKFKRGAIMAQKMNRGRKARKKFKVLYQANVHAIRKRAEEARAKMDVDARAEADRAAKEMDDALARREREAKLAAEQLEANIEAAMERQQEADEVKDMVNRRKSMAVGRATMVGRKSMAGRRTSVAVGPNGEVLLRPGGKLKTRTMAPAPPPKPTGPKALEEDDINMDLIAPPPPVFQNFDLQEDSKTVLRRKLRGGGGGVASRAGPPGEPGEKREGMSKRGSFFEFLARQQEQDFQVVLSGFLYHAEEVTGGGGGGGGYFSKLLGGSQVRTKKWTRYYYVLDKPARALILYENPDKKVKVKTVGILKSATVFKYNKDRSRPYGVELEDTDALKKAAVAQAAEKNKGSKKPLSKQAQVDLTKFAGKHSNYFAFETETLCKRWMKDLEDAIEGFRPSVPQKDDENGFGGSVNLAVIGQMNLLLYRKQITQTEFDELLARETAKGDDGVAPPPPEEEEEDEGILPLSRVLSENVDYKGEGRLDFGSAGITRKIDFVSFEEVVTLPIEIRYYPRRKKQKVSAWTVPRTFDEFREMYVMLGDQDGQLSQKSRLTLTSFPVVKRSRKREIQDSQAAEVEVWLEKFLGALRQAQPFTSEDDEDLDLLVPPPPEAPLDPALDPDNWRCVRDPETGELFFNNKVTGETRPEDPFKGKVVKKTENALPPNWEEVFDQDCGESYYINLLTEETTWDRPKDESKMQLKKFELEDAMDIFFLQEFFDVPSHVVEKDPLAA